MSRSGSPGIRRGVAPQFATPMTAPATKPLSEDSAVIGTLTEALKPSGSGAATVHYSERFSVQQTSDVALQPTTVEDIDKLWDWVRSDREGTTAFLGTEHSNTQTFFGQIAELGQKEREGIAWVRSIKRGDALVGFVVLNPIFKATQKPVGTCHIYVNTESRGSLPELLPQIVADGDRQLPGMTFMVATDKEAWATMLKAVGFAAQIVLTRLSAASDETTA